MAPRPKPRSARAGTPAKRSPARSASKAAPAKAPRKADDTKAAAKPDRKAKAATASRAKTPKAKSAPTKVTKAAPKKIKAAGAAAPAATRRKAAAITAKAPEPSKRTKPAPATDRKAKGSTTKVAAAPKRKSVTTGKPTPRTKTKRPAKTAPAYLAVELGTPVDPQGEPIGAGSPRAQSDRQLQEYALHLWRQMQRGSVTKRYMRSMERAGITLDEVWTVGLRETWTTSSTADEMRRYRQRMLFRANLLEAIMSETIADLHRLEGIEPSDGVAVEPPSEPAAPQS